MTRRRPISISDCDSDSLDIGQTVRLRPLRYNRDVSEPVVKPLRRDARRNREAILTAARELFCESAQVSMAEVRRRARVGHATLYRNFPDRHDLAAAVVADDIENLERLAAEHADDPSGFFVLLRSLVEAMARSSALSDLAGEETDLDSELERIKTRVGEIIKRPLRDAKLAGLLRCDLTVDDIFLIGRMVKGALDHLDNHASRAVAASRALSLVLDGVSPSGRQAELATGRDEARPARRRHDNTGT
jgi:AcrR family transcriptional regulator